MPRHKAKAASIYGNAKNKGVTPPITGAPGNLNTVIVNRMHKKARKSIDTIEADQAYRTSKLSPAIRKNNALFDPKANRSIDVMKSGADGSNFI